LELFAQGRNRGENILYKRWIGTLLVCIILLSMCVHPSVARLSEGRISLSALTAAGSAGQVRMYQIEAGDNLWDIARTNGVNLQSLMAINQLDQNSILDVGDCIKIPSGNAFMHVVSAGETMWSIAARYNITIAAIEKANADKEPDCLNIGDRLNIPGNPSRLSQLASLEPSRGISLGGLMAWPITGTISSAFGWRRSGFHHGLDIANKLGTPIKAAAAGTVIFTGWKAIYGRTVIIEHPDGKQTLYAHTQKILVRNQQAVERGQTIATVGVSGRTTGPHLHFEVKIGNKVYDPWKYLKH